jgi:phosphotriesterase-related protein
MKQTELVGKAQTVLGLVDPDCLGVTLPHEHLFVDQASVYFVEPTEASDKSMAHKPVRPENLYWIKTHWLGNIDNMTLLDEDLAIKEAMMFKMAGGSTIVEMSNIGLVRDPLALARVSRVTGLNVVMGSGYYVALSHPAELVTMAEEEISEKITQDILVGVGDSGMRSGIIGEIGCSTPLAANDPKILRASALAQRRTGAAINVHPGIGDEVLLEIIKILTDAGADLRRTVISHIDVFGFSRDARRKVLDAGCYLEYDTFGAPGTAEAFEGHYLDLPSDMKRVNDIIEHINDGYLNQIVLSHDICFKHYLVAYGGYGYAHILRYIVPVMRSKGLSDEQINTLLVDNPKRALTFVPAKD